MLKDESICYGKVKSLAETGISLCCLLPTKSNMEIVKHLLTESLRGMIMWTTPAYNDMRFGFEVTMYINNR